MNFLDSARISAGLQNAGHTLCESENEAEMLFVNSCTVTHQADRKSRYEALRASKKGKKVAIFGCGPKVDTKDWNAQFPDDLVFGSDEELFEHFGLNEHDIAFPESSRTRLPVAIQGGCDNVCSFCITTVARGDHFNIPLESIIRQINRAVEHGINEVVLTGINLAAWGSSNSRTKPEEAKLGELLKEILKQTEIPRVRISSIGPQFIHEDFYEAYADERICDHLHMSIQSGSPGVLEPMNRGHGAPEIYEIVKRTREIRPNTAYSADFIVGFPGETEKEFQETVEMIKTIKFAKLHVFPYSIREGTGAARMKDQVPEPIKKERAKILRDLGDQLRQEYLESQIGKELEFLVDLKHRGISPNYVFADLDKKAPVGSLQKVLLSPEILRES